VLGVAVGNDNKEIEAYKKQLRVSFPMVPDKEGEVFMALELQGVPCMIVTNKEGKVLMSHTGMIEDPDRVMKEIRMIHKQQ
jgi:hypothetical protein